MTLEKSPFFPGPKIESATVPEATEEEKSFMNDVWYHGSPKEGLKELKPNGGFLGHDDGIHVALGKGLPRLYGKNISQWRLKGPLKIIELEEIGNIDKNLLRKAGYVGFYWRDEHGVGSGVVWSGKDLEKLDETKED